MIKLKSNPNKTVKDMGIGCLSGLLTGILVQPLEIIKMNIVINPKKIASLEKNNLIESFQLSSKLIYKLEGLKGFFRGSVPSLLKIASNTTIFFVTFKYFDGLLKNYTKFNDTSSGMISSSISRVISGVLTNPLGLIKTRSEVIGFSHYNGMFDAISKIYKTEGVKGYFIGTWASTCINIPFAAIYMYTYKSIKRKCEEKELPLEFRWLFAGVGAGVIATIFTNPLDVIRSRLQYKKFNDRDKYDGVIDGIVKIYQKDGIIGYFRGISPRLIRKPLSNGLSFFFFEGFHKIVFKNEAF